LAPRIENEKSESPKVRSSTSYHVVMWPSWEIQLVKFSTLINSFLADGRIKARSLYLFMLHVLAHVLARILVPPFLASSPRSHPTREGNDLYHEMTETGVINLDASEHPSSLPLPLPSPRRSKCLVCDSRPPSSSTQDFFSFFFPFFSSSVSHSRVSNNPYRPNAANMQQPYANYLPLTLSFMYLHLHLFLIAGSFEVAVTSFLFLFTPRALTVLAVFPRVLLLSLRSSGGTAVRTIFG
jgi:hypothetical protein